MSKFKSSEKLKTGNYGEDIFAELAGDGKQRSGAEARDAETPEDLSELASDKIGRIIGAESDFEQRGNEGIENAIANNGFSPDKVQEIEKKTGIRNKMASLTREALENGKKKMLIAGLAMVIFSGTAEAEISKTSDLTYGQGKTRIESLNNKINPEQVRRKFEEIKNELIKHFQRPEYREKLAIEYSSANKYADIIAKNVQEERINNLKTVKLKIMTARELLSEELSSGKAKKGVVTLGKYNINSHVITVCYDNHTEGEIEDTLRHELLHSLNKGIITKSSEKILRDSFKNQSLGYPDKEKNKKYHSDEFERLERKQILDKEMEKLNIKKYGEPFTDEHYKKMIKYYHQGKFSRNAEEFIERTNPKFFKKIFDEIAENEYRDASENIQV